VLISEKVQISKFTLRYRVDSRAVCSFAQNVQLRMICAI